MTHPENINKLAIGKSEDVAIIRYPNSNGTCRYVLHLPNSITWIDDSHTSPHDQLTEISKSLTDKIKDAGNHLIEALEID